MIMKALLALRPKANWILEGDTLDKLIWKDEFTERPSDEEILAEVERQKVIYSNEQYKRDRAKEYPSIAEQLDLLYHGYDKWKEAIDSVKQKYPKTEV